MNTELPSPAAFEQWLRTLAGYESARVASIEPVEGGASNVTCRVGVEGDALPALALRMQRERGIFEPYDVVREGEVVRRLAASEVPVPALVASVPDASVLGAPFIVLEWVDAPHMGVAGAEADFGAYIEMVVRIHSLDWRAKGLGEVLAVPPGAAAAIGSELDAIAARMTGFGCDRDEQLAGALAKLRNAIPTDGTLSLCQGDINVYNYLFRAKEVVAVVDWEQAHIGDLRSDVGRQILALVHLRGMPFGPARTMPFVGAYEATCGKELANLEYFRALWLFELGVIHFGWKTFNDTEPWYSLEQLRTLLDSALAELG